MCRPGHDATQHLLIRQRYLFLAIYNFYVIIVLMKWAAEYYRDANGKEPVAEFINSLPEATQAKIFRLVKLLKDL